MYLLCKTEYCIAGKGRDLCYETIWFRAADYEGGDLKNPQP